MKTVMSKYNRVLSWWRKIDKTDIYYELPNEVGAKIERILDLDHKPDVIFLPKASVNTSTKWFVTSKWRHAMFFIDEEWNLKKINSTKYFWSSFFSKRWITQWFDIIQRDSRIYIKLKK